ncbi:universal stress protein [Mycobacterium antarcticum]|nr:universal stress protein [Mycolicibacterium sp. TUM20985]
MSKGAFMSESTESRGVVVAVDGSPASTRAVRWAARDAELRHVPLTLAHVLTATAGTWLGAPLPPKWTKGQKEAARQVLDEALAVVAESCHGAPPPTSCEMLTGGAVSTLVSLSKDADLLVVGRRGNGTMRGRPLGSVSSAVVHHAHCPVAVIHDEDSALDNPSEAPVLVGIDGSRGAELATAIAFDEASRRNVGLVALHAWTGIGALAMADIGFNKTATSELATVENEALAERLAGWSERYPDVPVERESVRNDPGTVLVDQSRHAQLVVVGGHGIGGFAGMLLGSVSSAVVQLARTPVIVARQP